MATKSHEGGCQCGAVRYQVELDADAPGIACNCSMCGRSGTILSFVPRDKLTVLQGEDHLTDYLFNRHSIHHVFCRTCGIKPFAYGDGPHGPVAAINLRCLDDVDPFALMDAAKRVDGKSR